MARVLVAANSSWNIENFRIGLIQELVRRGHDVTTVTPDADGPRIEGVQIGHRRWRIDRSGANPFNDLACLWSLGRIFCNERPDIFLGFTIKPNIYGSTLCRLFKIRAVPNVTGLGTAFLGSSRFRRTILLMYRFAFAKAAQVFFQNPDDHQLFLTEAVIRNGQGRILPGSGINLTNFSRSELPREARFLMIARLLGDKGVREYAEAARTLKAKFPAAKFSLLGELDSHNRSAIDRSELDRWIEEGAIEYLGAATDVRPFIDRYSVIVLPSYREGLPRTLLEGAAMGRPLVGTDVPGCRELVREGVTGFLCEARSARSLAAAMEKMANASHEERSRLGDRARAMAESEYDEALVVAAYVDVVERVNDL